MHIEPMRKIKEVDIRLMSHIRTVIAHKANPAKIERGCDKDDSLRGKVPSRTKQNEDITESDDESNNADNFEGKTTNPLA